VFGKTSADVHFREFVLASIVVVIASWGLLLILGEAMLFALAVFKADDRERYDIYRNLMILWGYVLTLGIPRHFRRLPAQFGAQPDEAQPEAHSGSRGRDGQGGGARGSGHRQNTGRAGDGRRGDTGRGDTARKDTGRGDSGGGRRPQQRAASRDPEDPRDPTGSPRDDRDPNGGGKTRDRGTRGERDGARSRTGSQAGDRAGASGRRTGQDRAASREGSAGGRTGQHQDRTVSQGRGENPREEVASLGVASRERPGSLGAIFPPRPAADAEVTSMSGPAVAPAGATVAVNAGGGVASFAETVPAADTELRNALDLLLRYAARFGGDEAAVPRPAMQDPGKAFGIVAETGGET
jgi:hypothetical protein